MLKEVLKQIVLRSRFLLTSHARPDGDAIGSALGCGEILRSMGKEAQVVLHDGVPRIYQSLPFADKVLKADRVNTDYDAAILLECDSIQRTRLQGLDHQFLINIDHHRSGRPFANVNWIDPKAVATAEMVFRIALESGVKVSAEIATCLYTAVLTDTGSFMFAGTNEHTFALARELVLAGADPVRCARNVYFGHSTAKMRLLGAALSHLQREESLAWFWVTQDEMERCNARDEDCEGLVNYALSIYDVQVAILLRELPDERVRASLRSKGNINVASVAEHFGGGGHECASGFSIAGPLPAALSRILTMFRPPGSLQ
jgi:bifunctional oligoribonuclease and PAP phosphatase NrnA